MIFATYLVLGFQQEERKGVNKAHSTEERIVNSRRITQCEILFYLKKAIRKLKGEGAFEINPPSVDWGKRKPP